MPEKPKIETSQIPIEWLYHMALREGNSKKPIYRIHKWWARRLGSIFRTLLLLAVTPSNQSKDEIIRDFYRKHDLSDLRVLDPFMGGGTSIVEARKCNANVIGVDIDPLAWFITKKEIEPCPINEIRDAVENLEQSVGKEIKSYYLTETLDNQLAPVIYFFWVDLITCPNCGEEFEAHPHYQLSRDKKREQQTVFCMQCHRVSTLPASRKSLTCPECQIKTPVKQGVVKRGKFFCRECNHSDLTISVITPGQPLPKRLFAVEYEAKNKRGELDRFYKAADANDLRVLQMAKRRFNELRKKLPFPRAEIPTEGRNDSRPIIHGYRYYYQLFNPRQLLCLSLLWREIARVKDKQVREYLMIAFSDSLASNNMLCSYAFGYRKLTPLFGLHAYNVVNRPVENNVWGTKYGRGSFLKCVDKMLRAKRYTHEPYEITYQYGTPKHIITEERITAKVATNMGEWGRGNTQTLLLNRSSTELECLESGSVDLILTDPPYYNNISYCELSDFYHAWLREYMPKGGRKKNDFSKSNPLALYVNKNVTKKSDPSYCRFVQDLTKVFTHCRRVLNPSGLMVFTFHHRDVNAWEALAKALWDGGFKITNIFPVRSEGKSGFHSTSGTIKWDVVLTCRPREGKIQSFRDNRGFLRSVKARQNRWKHSIEKAGLEFGWADSLSLGYGLATQQVLARASSPEDISLWLNKTKEFFLRSLTSRQLDLLSRTTSITRAQINT
jgi:adenine-specific DNA methylase